MRGSLYPRLAAFNVSSGRNLTPSPCAALSRLLRLLALPCLLLPLAVGAQKTTTWDAGASGTYGELASWDNGIPVAGDTARFLDAGEVEVTFTGNAEVALLVFQGTQQSGPPAVDPRLTFVLGTHEFTNSASARFNYTGPGTMTFVQNGGTFKVDSTFGLAWGSESPIPTASSRSVMIVENGGTLDVGNQLAVGYTGGATGELYITDGSRLVVGSTIWVGRNGLGVLRLEGAGTELDHAATGGTHFTMGHSSGGTGTLEILAGAELTTSRVMNLGQHTSSSGTLLVSGSGSKLLSTGNLNVGGYTNSQTGAGTPGGVGLATFAAGATATFKAIRTYAESPALGRLGTVEFDQSGGVTVDDAIFNADTVVRFALHANNQSVDLTVIDNLVVDGAFLEAFLAPLFEPLVGNSFALIGYGTLEPGAFANPNGQVIIGDKVFAIDYSLGGADVIGLTLIPEPGLGALAAGLVAAALILSRRRLSGRS